MLAAQSPPTQARVQTDRGFVEGVAAVGGGIGVTAIAIKWALVGNNHVRVRSSSDRPYLPRKRITFDAHMYRRTSGVRPALTDISLLHVLPQRKRISLPTTRGA